MTNHGASTYNLGEETKMIDGKLHKQVKEEKMEWDDKTNSQIKRIYIKYIPVDGEAHGHTQSHVPTSQPHVHNSHTHVTNSTPVTHNGTNFSSKKKLFKEMLYHQTHILVIDKLRLLMEKREL